MSVSLKKGQKVSLTKSALKLDQCFVGLGWDTGKYKGRYDFDLDVSVFMVGKNGRVKDTDFIFYFNKEHESGAVTHCGDNRTGDGDGDDEQVLLNLKKVPKNIEELVVVVTIYDGPKRGQNFGQVENAYIRLVNGDVNNEKTQDEIIRYNLEQDFSFSNSVVFCSIFMENGEWQFKALGEGSMDELGDICSKYGIEIE